MSETPKNRNDDDLVYAALSMTASMAQEERIVELLRAGLSLCIKVLNCDRALLLSQSGDNEPEIIEYRGEKNQTAYSKTALKLVNEKQEPLLISDTIDDAVLGVQESISSNEIRSVLCWRLDSFQQFFADTRVYLYLDSRTSRRPFSLADLEKFKLLSLLMATLIRKSALLQEREAQIEELKNQVQQRQFADLVFASASFEKCITLVKQSAAVDVPVLLVGETGTGKEALARIVHSMSRRNSKPFLTVNCGAIPANLIESELFGHEKGAFTGAIGMKKGYFEEAHEGSLFLDEIGELPLAMQARFLRVLQEGEITRVGSTKVIKVDVRIISATNVELEKAAAQGTFRKDLFYRLSVFPVTVPPVRQRGEDSLLLARYFLKLYGNLYGNQKLRFSSDCEKAILGYDWPGNVREIQNYIQRAVITAQSQIISGDDLGLKERSSQARYTTLKEAREAVDREMIAYALARFPNNLTNAAKVLDIDRKSLRLLLEKYGIETEKE
ncbi:MAG: sigma 54-interacting transcriptional regulator [Chitinivibrionales bacterium]|nr:sigma 54-interacting transcriptional regulator [Chitinivibrionales bacterium]